ncbi:MAG TPA: LacI family DNA-binding transcriptional regulator [Phycisphaerae bacterium]|nr:LacI family DNA-binding transcriptional regulator [Phycisphaerae bacterium]HPM23551.1 LacI family DNA-binding transcriptional regulator [Phycisphaerae bacterium]
MASVRKIADRAGVSIATVSRALHNERGISPDTRRRVLAVANSSGYFRATPQRGAALVGFVYIGEQTLSHPFDAAVLDGLSKCLQPDGYSVVILNPQRRRQSDLEYAELIAGMGMLGVVVRTMSESRDVCAAMAELGFPHVVISERFEAGQRISYVDCDSRSASIRAIEYLISLGHERIAFATHNVPDHDHLDRYNGYVEALAKHGLPLEEDLVFRHPADVAGGATVLKMTMSMRDRPTAIYFADWLLAIGGLKAAHGLGIRVPQDLSIMGVDDTDLRHTVHPTLTAVCQNAFDVGAKAGQALKQILAGQAATPLQITLPGFFEINESTGAPRPDSGHAGEVTGPGGNGKRGTRSS